MKEKILALLTAAFAGVRKDGLNQLARTLALQATTDEDAKTLVDKLTKAQVDEFVKEYRAEVDKEVSDGNKTFETNLKKKFDLVEKKSAEKGEAPSKETEVAELIKSAVESAVSPLKAEIEQFKNGDVAKSRLQSLTEKLNACKDENFKAQALKDFARMNFNSDDEFKEYLTEKETAITTANQNMADTALGDHGKPFFSQKSKDGVSQGVAEYVASQKPEASNALTGKEV